VKAPKKIVFVGARPFLGNASEEALSLKHCQQVYIKKPLRIVVRLPWERSQPKQHSNPTDPPNPNHHRSPAARFFVGPQPAKINDDFNDLGLRLPNYIHHHAC
jgi:hypothetical protein